MSITGLAERETALDLRRGEYHRLICPRQIYGVACELLNFEENLEKLPSEPHVDEGLKVVVPVIERVLEKIKARLAPTARPDQR